MATASQATIGLLRQPLLFLCPRESALRVVRGSRRMLFDFPHRQRQQRRGVATESSEPENFLDKDHPIPLSWLGEKLANVQRQPRPTKYFKAIPEIPNPPKIGRHCPDPIAAVTARQLSVLDPSGARARLFDPSNPDCARPGDVLLVRLRTGDPVSGTCIKIVRAGVDTSVHLRNTLTRVGVETQFKVFAPTVAGIEVVQRAQRRMRRARLYYLRQPRHDPGSVEGIVRRYLRKGLSVGVGAREAAAAAEGARKSAAEKKRRKKGRK